VDQPYEYQNGGLWDWFGAKLVFGMFERGYSAAARDKLLELARKDIGHGGLFEWDAPDGSGRGSPFYAGSAGSLAKALFEGYFGIRLTRDGLELSPRLGEDSARVHIRIPAAGSYAAYEYRWDAATDKVVFRYESNIEKLGTLRIVLPSALSGKNILADNSLLQVTRDGRPVTFSLDRLNKDIVLKIQTDFHPQTLIISLSEHKTGK
jgi:hypothetical protein